MWNAQIQWGAKIMKTKKWPPSLQLSPKRPSVFAYFLFVREFFRELQKFEFLILFIDSRASFFIAQKSFFFKRIFHKNIVIKNTFFFEKIKKEQTAE